MKFTFDQALDHINDERSISASEVQARALRRYIAKLNGGPSGPSV